MGKGDKKTRKGKCFRYSTSVEISIKMCILEKPNLKYHGKRRQKDT